MELKQFKISVLPLRDKLTTYARKLTNDPTDAEDAVQEAMIKLWNIRRKLEEYRSIEALAMKITYNACMDIWRRKKADTFTLDQVPLSDPSYSPEGLLEEKDELCIIKQIIDSLPVLQRSIIKMKDIDEYETDEIAAITGCSQEAIRSNLSRARKKVRDIYLQIIQERKRRN